MRSSPEKSFGIPNRSLTVKMSTNLSYVFQDQIPSAKRKFLFTAKTNPIYRTNYWYVRTQNLMIQEAHITTSTQDYAFDTITVVDHLGQALTPSRKKELQARLEKNIQSPRIVKRSHRLLNKKPLPIKITTQILFLQSSPRSHKTSFELITYDRPGLLAQVFDVFTHLQCIRDSTDLDSGPACRKFICHSDRRRYYAE